MQPASAHLAAVVVPVRIGAGGIETYWVRRAPELAFLGGFWSFPGGRIDAADHAALVPGASGAQAARIACAARELAEETGAHVPPSAAAYCLAGRSISPPFFALRFDATYFLVQVPPAAVLDVSASGGELVQGEWIRPADAIARWRSGEAFVTSVLFHVMTALHAGLDGACERLSPLLESEETCRAWDIFPGVRFIPLRTPTLPPATHTNCYVVGGSELVVIDPASPYDDERAVLLTELRRMADGGRRVREIWLTHHHVDHVSGAMHLAAELRVPVVAHDVTARLLKGRVRVDRAMADGETTTLAGGEFAPARTLRAVFTPGHAAGHLCFLEESTRAVIAGDMVAGIGSILVDPDDGDMTLYLESLARMRSLAPRMLLPAHGSPIAAALAKIDEYVSHRLWREDRLIGALTFEPVPLVTLVPKVYDDVPAAIHPLAARSLLAHALKLEREGRAVRYGDAWARAALQ